MDEEKDGISIWNIGGVFIVILIGIALSIVTLAFEYWYYKDRPPRRSAKNRPVRRARPGFAETPMHPPPLDNNNELKEINANGTVNNGVYGVYNTAYNHD